MDHGPSPLVGRDGEMAVLHDVLERCREGRASMVVLRGEAGIGKTRLLDVAEQLAGAEGMDVFRWGYVEGDADVPIRPLRTGLDRLDAGTGTRDDLGRLFATTRGRDLRYEIVERTIDAALEMVDAHQPVVFLVEDVHHADPESLQVMRAVVRRASDRGVAYVLAARPRPRPPNLAQMERDGVRVLDLQPLGREDVARMAAARLGAPPGPRLADELDRTGGNPLLLEELLHELARTASVAVVDGRAELRPAADPPAPDLAERTARRLAALGAPARQVVELVALADLSPAQLARLLDTTVARAAAWIAEAVEDGMVVEEGGQLRLRHDLLRGPVLDGVPAGVRVGLHADLLRLLTEDGVDATRVVPHAVEAGDRDAIADAGRLLLPTAPAVAASLLARAHRAGADDVAVDLAQALVLTGQVSAAEALLADDERIPAGAAARARLTGAQLRFLRGDLRRASTAFEQVAPELQDPAERCLAMADAAVSSLLAGQLDRAEGLAARVGTTAEGGPDAVPAAAGLAGLVQAWTTALAGDPGAALALADEGYRRAVSAPKATGEAAQPEYFLAQVQLWAESPAHAAATAAQGLARVDERGTPWARAPLHAVHAEALLRLGRLEDAEAEAEAAVTVAADLEVEHGLPSCEAIRARIATARGTDAGPALEAGEQTAGRLGGQGADVLLWARGLTHLAGGRHAEAAQVLGFLWGRLDQVGLVLRMVHVAPDLVRAAVVADPGRAAAVEQRLAELVGTPDGWLRPRAALLHARGLLRRDVDALDRAAALLEQLDDPLEAARVHADAAGIAEGEQAEAHRRRAALAFDAAGATAWLDAVRAPEGRTAVPAEGWASLTPAQARIVHLVGQGLSNTEIATRLSVSRRTVESHLYHSYAKLGLTSRVQLGLAAARRTADGWQPPRA